MNSYQTQFSTADNTPPSFIPIYSQDTTSSTYRVISAPQIQYQQAPINNSTIAQTVNPQNQTQPVHSNVFIYKPPNDLYNYHTKCEITSNDLVTRLINDLLNGKSNNIHLNENKHIFFYWQQFNNQYYQITCEMASPTLINCYLNKNILGIEIEHNEQEQLVFTLDQKENLEFHLTQYLNNYLLI